MKIQFLVWMLGYPLVIVLEKYFTFLRGDWMKYSDSDKQLAALAETIIWFVVGYFLWSIP